MIRIKILYKKNQNIKIEIYISHELILFIQI